MEGEDIGSESLQSSNWEVYKDAFALPQPSRRVKAWERAPVPAHAPRLQGQKVWKKVAIKPQLPQADKEIHEAVQAELEKAGMGARKRARMIGGKENISDALWKKSTDVEDLVDIASPKKQRLSMGPGDADAFVVPRKRTNANHLITPRKPLRKTRLGQQAQTANIPQTSAVDVVQIPLNEQAPTRDASKSPAKLSQQKIPLNGQEPTRIISESHAESSPQKLTLNDLNQDGDRVAAPIGKPVRSRKSLRKSTRRLTRGTTPEQPSAASVKDTLANHVSGSALPIVQAPKNDSEPPKVVPDSNESQSPAIATTALEPGRLAPISQEPISLISSENSVPGSPRKAELLIGDLPATPEADKNNLTKCAQTHHNDVPTTQTSRTADEELPKHELGPATVIHENFPAKSSQTPKSQPPVLNSIELGIETRFVSPTKSAGTPRSRRKTPQRGGSRRSTRSTRANSVPPEDHSAQQDSTSEASKSEISNPPSSPIKPRILQMSATKANNSSQPSTADFDSSLSTEIRDTENTNSEFKHSADIESQHQGMESTQSDGITATLRSSPTNDLDHVDALETVSEDVPSDAEPEGEQQSLDVTVTVEDELSVEGGISTTQQDVTFELGAVTAIVQTKDDNASLQQPSQSDGFAQNDVGPSQDEPREVSVEALEVIEPISISLFAEELLETVGEPSVELDETSTPNPSTTELVETISENTPANTFDHDDTDMLRNFLTRVKANKAAKAGTSIPKRKRSLPHSPIRLPLGSDSSNLSPSSPKSKDEFDVSLPVELSNKRKRDDAEFGDDEATEPKSIRRSGRTRLPVKAAPLAAPSFIPVRRLGQDGDNTVTLRRSEEKELAALTRVNTRKNKGAAVLPIVVLAKQADEKEDPASRQRALKEIFDEKAQRQKKGKKRKTVVWAEQLAQFQTEEGKTTDLEREPEKEKGAPSEEKKSAVKVGVRSKMALGMAVNGTPAPKRKMRGRS